MDTNFMAAAMAIVSVAAAGWAFLYWIFGGGFFGAIVLFAVLKMFGK